MTMENWKQIAETVYNNYKHFAGFVILHGTDTMAYTSSALSFMLQNLGKAVVVTGSQVPLAQLRTDAIENFIGSLILAGRYGSTITEVGLFFANTLFRGNRATKVNASGFAAFDSPNYHSLAKIGVNVESKLPPILLYHNFQRQTFTVNKDALWPTDPSKILILHKEMDPSVGVFMLFPGIQGDMASLMILFYPNVTLITRCPMHAHPTMHPRIMCESS